MTDDYNSTRASGSSVCNRRSKRFTLQEMNNDYQHFPERFSKKYGISTDAFVDLRRKGQLTHFLQGHDTCPRLQYISKITPRSADTQRYVSAWNDSKQRYSDSKGLYSGDIECVVCKEPVSTGGYCKETACMGGKCWKHLAAGYNVRILNASDLLGERLYTTSETDRLPQFNGVYYSPDNEILVPALYAWSLKHHLTVMHIMNTPYVYNIQFLKKYIQAVFPVPVTGTYPFLKILYAGNKKIWNNVSMSLMGNADNYRRDPVAVLSKQINAFMNMSAGSRDMKCQLLFHVLFQCALTLDSAKSMSLYGDFMRVLTDSNPQIVLAGKNGTVAKYISGNSFDLDDVSDPLPFGNGYFDVTVLKGSFPESASQVSKRELEAEFEAVDVDLVHPNRIPYVYGSAGANTLLDCRTHRILANYILPNSREHDTRITFQGTRVTVNAPVKYIHGSVIESSDAPDWYTMAAGQPMVILQRTYRTFYTDNKRGSVSNLIVRRLRKDSTQKSHTGNNNRVTDRTRFKSRTTTSGRYRA